MLLCLLSKYLYFHPRRVYSLFKHSAENGNYPKLTILDTHPSERNQDGSEKTMFVNLID